MRTNPRLAATFIITAIMMPFRASALSVNQYEAETEQQRVDLVASHIATMVAEFAKTNPAWSQSVHDYFAVRPAPDKLPPGVIAFEGDLLAVENLAKAGKADLDKIQIEKILLNIVKHDLIDKPASKDGQDAPKK